MDNIPRFLTKDAAEEFTKTQGGKSSYGYPKSIRLNGSIKRQGEDWHPNFVFKMDTKHLEAEGFCVGLVHTIQKSSYVIEALLWTDKHQKFPK